jgi:beta-1,2-mannobiose phosphorylase / 1,2-beta-oligomannan phosphorylase
MLKVRKEGVILEKSSLKFENKAVLNPTCIKKGNFIHMFYRAVRKNNLSCIGYCKLKGPLKVVERSPKPILCPEFNYDRAGLEDPRITYMDNKYYLLYTTFDGKNARVAYAVSKDLKNFTKQSIISPDITYDEAEDLFRHSREKHGKLKDKYFFFESYFKDKVGKDVILWEKDAILFPKKFNNKYAMIHRILPEMQIIYFKDFKDLTLHYWKNYLKHLSKYIMVDSNNWFESRNVGGGATPIKTKKGWLIIYHAVEDTNESRIYRAGAALVDLKNPVKLIGKLKEPLFSPEEKWEKKGDTNNVVFPTGTALFGKRLYIYYGAADSRIAAASVNIDELLAQLTKKKRG